MDWTVRFYINQAEEWRHMKLFVQGKNDSGAVAYASQKVEMWMDMAQGAIQKFKETNPLYKSHIQ